MAATVTTGATKLPTPKQTPGMSNNNRARTTGGKKGNFPFTQGGEKKEGKKRRKRRRAPTTAAVALTCPAGEYGAVMREARERINLADLGIGPVRPRRAVTGALLLEIAGDGKKEKADALVVQLRAVLAEKEMRKGCGWRDPPRRRKSASKTWRSPSPRGSWRLRLLSPACAGRTK